MNLKLIKYLQQIAIPGWFATLFFALILFSSATPAEKDKAIIQTDEKLHRVLLFQWSDGVDSAIRKELISLFKGLPAKIEGFDKLNMVDLMK